MIYLGEYSIDWNKFYFMWRQWNDNRYFVENLDKTLIEEWKTTDDYILIDDYLNVVNFKHKINVNNHIAEIKWSKVNNYTLFIDWIDKFSFNWDLQELQISDDWNSFSIIYLFNDEYVLIKDWEILIEYIEKYKNFDNLIYKPSTHLISFRANINNEAFDSVIIKEWKEINKWPNRISEFVYSLDGKKLIYITEELGEKFLVEIIN